MLKKLPVTIARYFNTIGPGQLGDYGMVVPIFIQKALAGEDIPIFGDGTQKEVLVMLAMQSIVL